MRVIVGTGPRMRRTVKEKRRGGERAIKSDWRVFGRVSACVAGVRCGSNPIVTDLEQVPLSELLKAQRKLATQQHGSDSDSDSAPATSSTSSNSKTRLETIKRQLLLLQQKKGKALTVPVPHVPEPEYSDEEGKGDPRDGGEGSRNNLWDVRNARKEDRAREREWEEKRAEEREKRKRDGKHA